MRKICVITGSRADTSPMASVLSALSCDGVQLNHLVTEGLYDVETLVHQFLKHNKPDIVVLLGDRYETLVAASVAALLCVPIAHIGGGDQTQGAVDDKFRNAITKLSHWHFTCHPFHTLRLYAMAEDEKNIYTVGETAADNLVNLMSKEECEAELGFRITDKCFLVTYHPETLSEMDAGKQVSEVVRALDRFPDAQIILTGTNMDIGAGEITSRMIEWISSRANISFKPNYERRLYNSLMKYSTVVIGNSSTGVIEATILRKLSVNIGERQKGRIRTKTVIDVACNTAAIFLGINKALALATQQDYSFHTGLSNHYGIAGTIGKDIATTLIRLELPKTARK